MSDSQVLHVLQRDFSEEFRDALFLNLAGAYDRNYEDVLRPPGGFIPQRNSDLDELDLTRIRKARRPSGLTALVQTAQQCGVPYQVKRLSCNGQQLVVVQLGQLLLIAEPIDYLSERPDHAQYKSALASSHFATRQLEMDFGDHPEESRYRQRIDARNTMLVVVQHGMRSGGFNRRDTALAMMNVVVPDASFSSLLFRANAMNDELSIALEWVKPPAKDKPVQEDRVTPTLKAGAIQKDR